MKKRFVLILLAILLLSGCGPLQEKTEKIQIVATIFPLYDFAREIAGEDAEVKMLLKPGAEVHSYEPTPQDIIAIQNCDVFLYIGGESDEWVRNVLSSVDTSRMQVLTLMDCVDAAEEAESGFAWSGEDGHDHDHDDDEHEHHHDHDHDCCGHDHHHHHADEVFTSWGKETPKKYTEEGIRAILDTLSKEDSNEYGIILRAKGIVPDENGKWIHFDLVPGEDEVRYGSAEYTGRICVIGSKLNEDKLAELFGL